MVQALICANDWLKARGLPCVDVEETLKDLEEMEKDVLIIIIVVEEVVAIDLRSLILDLVPGTVWKCSKEALTCTIENQEERSDQSSLWQPRSDIVSRDSPPIVVFMDWFIFSLAQGQCLLDGGAFVIRAFGCEAGGAV
ncbi:hypothetical protein SOVF_030590 [Spinacia oleracea]|nr:hypothetical protein SOVF_030590 [Spinacia oleracea]